MTADHQPQTLRALGLFLRGGIFHVLFEVAGVLVEIALHGISTLEEALQAVARLACHPTESRGTDI